MANLQAPYGFRHVGYLGGQVPNFANSSALVAQAYATPLFFGDPVVRLASGYIAKAPAGATQIHGVFIGCEYLSISRGYKWRSNFYMPGDAGADVTAWVIAHPNATFQVQTGNSATTAAPATQLYVGQNININYLSVTTGAGTYQGNVGTGVSTAYADLSTAAAPGATLPFRITGLVLDPPGVNGADVTTAFNDIIVTFNNQDFKSLSGI